MAFNGGAFGGGGGGGFKFGQQTPQSTTPTSSQPAQASGTNSPATSSAGLFGGGGFNSGNAFGATTTSSAAPNAPATTGAMFGGGGSSLFGNKTSTPPTGSVPSFGGGMKFGAAANSTPASGKTSNLFQGSTTPAGTPAAMFGAAKPATSLFNQQTSTSTTTPATSAAQSAPSLFGSKPAAATTQSSPFSFSSASAAPNSTATSKPATTAGTSSFAGFSLGGTPAAAAATTTTSASTPTTAPSQTTGQFGSGNTAAASTPTSTAPPKIGSILFGGGPATTAPGTSTSASSTTATNAPTATFGFGGGRVTNVSNGLGGGSGGGTLAPITGTNTHGAPKAAAVGASSSNSGPPPQQSRLKNKTMDEIITRWATDLSKYQKDFQDQAMTVASWDRLLVENGEKIQKLYSSAFEAERATKEVEAQLSLVEGQQGEVEDWLDKYEAEVDAMFTQQVGETLQGADQERERIYKLAERMSQELTDMGTDLWNMIGEINGAQSALNKTNKPDDPLSQIVRVLNGHLTQLQWIDSASATLQKKITAQKQQAQINSGGIGGGVGDIADDFHRSWRTSRR